MRLKISRHHPNILVVYFFSGILIFLNENIKSFFSLLQNFFNNRQHTRIIITLNIVIFMKMIIVIRFWSPAESVCALYGWRGGGGVEGGGDTIYSYFNFKMLWEKQLDKTAKKHG